MKPYIICHMLSSIDGKIDGSALKGLAGKNDYEITAEKLGGNAWLCGRVTMQLHFADKEPFISSTNKPAGSQPVHIARKAESYAIAVDTMGKLRWSTDNIDNDHLVCIVSEQVPEDYLKMLKETGISYIVTGKESIDLTQAMNLLGEHFEIDKLLLEGGGHINGAFIEAGLVDEISLLLAPGIDGRTSISTVFDGISPENKRAFPLKLKSAEQITNGTLWLRYEAISSEIIK